MAISKKLAANIIKDLPKDPNARLVALSDIQSLLTDIKKIESTLRKEMLEEFFSDRKEGTNTHALGKDWKVVCTQPYTRKIDAKKLDDVLEKMPRGSKQKLIKLEPKLVLSEYRKLDDKTKAIFDEAVTLKNGSATLKLVAPETVDIK